MTLAADPASFRDPSGFVYTVDGVLYRQVNPVYRAEYDHLMASGLYDALVQTRSLVAHEEEAVPAASGAYRILRPERVGFISYPYEWCFGQLKDAALLTLSIQEEALRHDMWLRDASAFNVQFAGGRPIFIDTLSFGRVVGGAPWPAYRQFCQHFLAPLALMSTADIRLNQILRAYLDGVPLDLAAHLLPLQTRLKPALLTHLHLHAAAQRRHAATDSVSERPGPSGSISKTALLALVDNLKSAIQGLNWEPGGTEWADYYAATNYTDAAMAEKERLVSAFLDAIDDAPPRSVWDLGANDGRFSRIASARRIPTVAWDIDPAAVEKNYRACRRADDPFLLPLVQDLTNPSPSLGWAGAERDSLAQRGPADVVFALALIHHLAIANNVPLERVARFFRQITGRFLIVEWVPKSDSQARRLLAHREDIFGDYTRECFEAAFQAFFSIEQAAPIAETQRVLYRLRVRDEREDRPA